uniref:WAGO-1 n=1 Tax=Ascaris suum TaxID=6253 RepID=F1KRV0_ASCSU|nr:WAGO-1 [Ascaris suum]
MAAGGMRRGEVEELARRAERMEIQDMPVRFAEKVTPGRRHAETVDLISNVWGVIPKKNVPIYRYDVRILEEFPPKASGDAPTKEVTKQCRDDFPSIERKNRCVAVFLRLLEREEAFFGKRESVVYDRASILYTLDRLQIENDETKTFIVTPNELPEGSVSTDCVRVLFNIKQCTEDFQLTTSDLKQGVSLEGERINRSLQQFFELLASQEAFFTEGRFVTYGTGQSFLFEPYDFGFRDQDMPPLPDGKYIGIGASKGVKLIEGPSGPGGIHAALVMDVKKAAFHVEQQSVAEKVAMIFNVDLSMMSVDPRQIPQLKKLLKGLYVRCEYGKQRVFMITNIATQNALQMRFRCDDMMVTVADYFASKYDIRLKYPQLPLVIERRPSGESYYPMEKLIVCENQRVTQTQQSSAQVQAMIKACATLPIHRIRQTTAMTRAMKLDGTELNRWMREYSVNVTKNLTLKGRVLPPPQIEYGRNERTIVNPERTTWLANRNHYLLPAKCEKWHVVALVGPSERFFSNDKLRAYVRAFMNQCRHRGMQMADPMVVDYVRGAREQEVDVRMQKAKQMGATFVHFVTSDMLKFHGHIKLVEMQLQIVTQDLTTRTASQAPQKWQTLDNIVNKTNLKLGGINFGLILENEIAQKWLMNEGRLVVGIDVAHPPLAAVRGIDRTKVPSVVGYSSNCKKFPLEFIGGYRYATANMEELTDNSIRDVIVDSIRKFQVNRGKLPDHLFILRDGISEGQYKYVVVSEVEGVKKACGLVGGIGYRPNITYIVATKLHNMRLFKKNINQQDKATGQNIKPGTVVDKHIVNPVLNEFYLNSHSAFQGTAKTPRYTILFDTAKMPSDEIQAIVYALAYNHQIVNAAISLPAPIVIAARMASRGRSNYAVQFGEGSDSTEGGRERNIAELNANMGYMDKPLSDCRFNA